MELSLLLKFSSTDFFWSELKTEFELLLEC